jgi:enoyl-CoA hydratase/carnithine racemase
MEATHMQTLLVERDAGVVTLTLNRPERKNAIDVPLWRELARTLAEVADSAEDRVLLLTGAGGDFCAGGDLSGAESSSADGQRDPLDVMRETVSAVCLALHHLPKPTLAAVSGAAAGAGANLAFGCDLVIAADSARFAELFVKRALPVDSGGTWLLPRLVGLQKAKELAFFGDFIGAEQARELGLVNRVVPAARLPDEARAWAARLAERAPAALAAIKRGMNGSFESSLAECLDAEARGLVECAQTPEFADALRAFRGGRSRPPGRE